nr:response regulator [uncultured Rhodopila sp.]
MLFRVRDAMAAEPGVAAAALGSCLVLWLLGFPGLVLSLGLGLLVAAWCAGAWLADTRNAARLSESRQALDAARRQLAATEETLRGSRRLETVGRLAVGIAHDFNNQLTVISANVEMLKRSLGAADGRLLRRADAAMQGVQRAAALTGRVLALSRAAPAEPEAVDVNRLLDGMASLLRRGLGDRATLRLRLLRDPWFVWADVNRMENALLALAAEAAERVPDGGTLTVAAEPVTLATGCRGLLPGDYVRIAVTAPQAGRLAGETAAGAAALAREAGGAVLPCDDPASCRLLLPRHLPPPAAVPAPRSAGGRATILVVEDDAELRAACVEVLRDLGYAVLEAPDAMEGFRVIADGGGIDLLFTDVGLPGGVSGRALADAVRQVDGGVRVVFTTGYAAAGEPHRPGTALLPKPFGSAQLAGAVRQALDATPKAPP